MMFTTDITMIRVSLAIFSALLCSPSLATGLVQEEAKSDGLDAASFAGLRPREVGPALSSGRITDFAVDPDQHSRYFVATAAGGVWRTENSGTTWTPIFDGEDSYSIGCITMDPENSNVLWVGSGENNSQRSVSFGDGVYKSLDGGQTWANMGLQNSEHIGMIAVDPKNSKVVYVAAQGPLWRAGGDRGLYKTTDGGSSWECVLHIDEHTGANEVMIDPWDSNVVYVSTYQRRRHVWTLINGGPGSGIYKSTDAGATFREVTEGLPAGDKGRIGMALSPANSNVLYAIIEAMDGESGVWRSSDRGESWHKQSDRSSSSPQYYNELVCDPVDVDTLYSLDTYTAISTDGGVTWERLGNLHRHVDDHALWIDPNDNTHILIGGDGGIFESFDRGAHWDFKENLSLTQFYRVSADQATPFYNVYGGTQDNNSLGGPSRTTRLGGINNEDWFVTVGGDGYEVQVDPLDPNIVYSQWQYGGLIRLDRKSGETTDIKPRQAPDEAPYVWNWDSPLVLSQHSHTRLYFAADRLFRSDDRGDSWRSISGDLSRGIERDQLEVMGRIWEVDAIAKNKSTSVYGNVVSLAESPLDEAVLYAGSDDGLVHVTNDGGANWRRLESFPGVPEQTYVARLEASRHSKGRVYAAFDNHKQGDFQPYLLVSEDHGSSWQSIAGDLPERNVVYALVEDHENPNLLFCGTEFGAYFSIDRGQHWLAMSGLPTIAVRDLEIQRRENDLILGTFGRGIWILDDYAPLRQVDPGKLSSGAQLYPVRKAPLYIPGSRLGLNTGLGTQGSTFFAAENPPFGALLTFSLSEKPLSRKERRHQAEKEAREAGKSAPYPTDAELRAEDREEEPQVFVSIADANGQVLRIIDAPREAGMHRVAWDLREPKQIRSHVGEEPAGSPWGNPDVGPLVLPGTYAATLHQMTDGQVSQLAGPVEFEVESLGLATLPAADRSAVLAFQRDVSSLRRAVRAANAWSQEARDRIIRARKSVLASKNPALELFGRLHALESELDDLGMALRGDSTRSSRSNEASISIGERVNNVSGHQFFTSSAPTTTERDALRFAQDAFEPVLDRLQALDKSLGEIEGLLDSAGAPWLPGQLPKWQK